MAATFAGTYLADRYPQLNRNTHAAIDLWAWNSFAPRAAASWQVDQSGKTVVKGGYARYYHHLNAQQVWTVNRELPDELHVPVGRPEW